MKNRSPFRLQIADGEVDVRSAVVRERLMDPFSAEISAVAEVPLDLAAVVGRPASLSAITAGPAGCAPTRTWTGVLRSASLVRVEPEGLQSYRLALVATPWLMTQRRNLRIFQYETEVAIALRILREWGFEPELRLEASAFGTRKYRVQHDESDWAFVRRNLESAGVSLWFEECGGESRLVLGDRPQTGEVRPVPLPFRDDNDDSLLHARDVHVVQRVRPGRYTIRDHDYRRPHDEDLVESAEEGEDTTRGLERYHYLPGAFLFGADGGEDTAVADARGKTRAARSRGQELARKRLEAKRASGKVFTFETNAADLGPGSVVQVEGHPRRDLGAEHPLLVLQTVLSGGVAAPLRLRVSAVSAERAYRPPLVTRLPEIRGVHYARVVGAPGEEIHVDEFGRVRLQFHWDREGAGDDRSSCLAHVSQPWAGVGFGGVNLPRVGQDVIVDFLGGAPDRPIVTGRLFSVENPVPYRLPENKTQSGWRSQSTGGRVGHNEIMLEDKAGQELMRVHAQRDLSTVVKHDATHTVGRNRSIRIAGDDAKDVGGTLGTRVLEGPLTVLTDASANTWTYGDSSFRTSGPLSLKGGEGLIVRSGSDFVLQAGKQIEIVGGASVTFQVADSVVRLTPQKIEVFAPATHLTPTDGGGAG